MMMMMLEVKEEVRTRVPGDSRPFIYYRTVYPYPELIPP